jgi:hypothetical protein
LAARALRLARVAENDCQCWVQDNEEVESNGTQHQKQMESIIYIIGGLLALWIFFAWALLPVIIMSIGNKILKELKRITGTRDE